MVELTRPSSLQCIQTSLAQFREVWIIWDHILLPSQYRSYADEVLLISLGPRKMDQTYL